MPKARPIRPTWESPYRKGRAAYVRRRNARWKAEARARAPRLRAKLAYHALGWLPFAVWSHRWVQPWLLPLWGEYAYRVPGVEPFEPCPDCDRGACTRHPF